MPKTTCHISVSLDGFVAGPDATPDEPLGRGGERLHEWALATAAWRAEHGREGGEENVDSEVIARVTTGVGACIMGRRMWDGGDGPLDPAWQGWWGDEPPFHTPVFVLTHHPREPLALTGTTFHFVDGIDAALAAAREAADDQDVMVVGGGQAVQEVLRAGELDELWLHVAPVVLSGGAPLWHGVGDPVLEPVEVLASPAVTHVRYRVGGQRRPA
ncbi:dihydrofolate reductase family protein [Conexibacter sp. SYSU D00693]|uniref:dihydrofolate reductase family protein n=1 Tax=Conexibacter sp. SYSU D00693 TaxID=2812560 RepID=UPI00196B6640|nr:dihydrofolate reductase family protein [Conexibacter sp. SYSU D00693]